MSPRILKHPLQINNSRQFTFQQNEKTLKNASLLLQIGALKNYYLLTHRHVHKRSLDTSEHHHKLLRDEAQVSLSGLLSLPIFVNKSF